MEESYNVYAYKRGSTVIDICLVYEDLLDAIDAAKLLNYDEIVNDRTGEVVWRNSTKI